jgi:hypothetical protein
VNSAILAFKHGMMRLTMFWNITTLAMRPRVLSRRCSLARLASSGGAGRRTERNVDVKSLCRHQLMRVKVVDTLRMNIVENWFRTIETEKKKEKEKSVWEKEYGI